MWRHSKTSRQTMRMLDAEITSRRLGRSYPVWLETDISRDAERLCVFLDGEFYRERMATVEIVERLVADADIPPVSMLFVSQIDAAARHRDYACNADYTRFLVEELLPWGRAEGLTTADEAVLAGLSLSGLAAAYAGIEHPDVFPRVLCQSPSAWWNDEWLARHVRAHPRVDARFWISVGLQETEAGVRHPPTDMAQNVSQLDSCRSLASALSERSASTQFVEFDGGHEMSCWESDLPEALCWLLRQTLPGHS